MSSDAPELTRQCGTNEYHRYLIDTEPAYKPTRQSLEQFNHLYRRNQTLRSGVALIPVVVHVVYNGDAANITEAQVDSQIVALNADFNAQNADISEIPTAFKPLLGEARIRFFRVQRDPQGKRHPGITRTRTSIQAFNQNGNQLDQRMKSAAQGGHDAWPSDRYLNIWVCDLGRELLGYAQFPGGPIEKDGVVINHTAFGTTGTSVSPFNLGRTTTHEVAHWLNVYHIWGDDGLACSGSDYCDDTPNQAGSNRGRPQFPHVSCGNGQSGDMFMNFMDYTDDEAMFMFTKGQVARMNATLTGPRSSLIGSNFQEPILQTGTRLFETDETFDFLVADWNRDGVQDLIAIKKQNTASKTTELHILSGRSNFQEYLLQTDTILPETDDTFEFAMADWNGDKSLDLVAIKKRGLTQAKQRFIFCPGPRNIKPFFFGPERHFVKPIVPSSS
ncbi:ulilysin [Penicillium argentinense]|uniref:Ulilysin n=1 Tax=Penicillium argentinense TaxID=1131581 RepID=A0A9W9EXE6_9EURO|nr:ulilysin [Penicillium argentinense]KAJ5089585.1 ulilysin [Penicillium argentinense]